MLELELGRTRGRMLVRRPTLRLVTNGSLEVSRRVCGQELMRAACSLWMREGRPGGGLECVVSAMRWGIMRESVHDVGSTLVHHLLH